VNKTPIPPINTSPRIFATFIQEYNLSPCEEIKDDQTWRQALGNKVLIYLLSISQIYLFINSLNEYSVCEKQIMTNNTLEKLKAEDTSSFQEKKYNEKA
jgi:hypothetical protein